MVTSNLAWNSMEFPYHRCAYVGQHVHMDITYINGYIMEISTIYFLMDFPYHWLYLHDIPMMSIDFGWFNG